MKVIVYKSDLNGEVPAPPSKSYTHRAIFCGLLSQGKTRVKNPLYSDDTNATIRISKMLGAYIEREDGITITGPRQLITPSSKIDCGGSGTTLRIFTALSSLTNGRCVLTGDMSLRARPMTELLNALRQLGVDATSVHGNGKPPVTVNGRGLDGGNVRIRGDISSQYITGLVLAGTKAQKETSIEITTKLESRPYIEMTIEVMKQFGVSVHSDENWNTISVPGRQTYTATEYEVPGDYSSAAFPLIAGALSGSVSVTGLDRQSLQGDSQIVHILERMGGKISLSNERFSVNQSDLSALEIDVSNIPDLVPILAVLATQAHGTTRIYNAVRLRYKESDRLTTTQSELSKMGARINKTEDGLTIEGPTTLNGANIHSHQDHRIAMAGIIAGLIAKGSTTVDGAECITKSYPEFIKHIQELKGEIEIIEKERRTTD